MEFKETIKLAEDIIQRFEKVENKPWKAEASMIELSKQVGQLANEIMICEKYYCPGMKKDSTPIKEKIEDELADIFYSIIRIAKHYNIDLEKAHLKARQGEDEFLKKQNA